MIAQVLEVERPQHLDDVSDAGKGEVADLLRPFYLEYLRNHGVQAP